MASIIQPYAHHISELSARVSPAIAVRFAVAVAHMLMTWDERFRTRQQLKKLTEHDLRDMGLTRSDVHKELRRPFFL